MATLRPITTGRERESTFERLPDSLTEHSIFSFLHEENIICIQACSKRFWYVANSPNLWMLLAKRRHLAFCLPERVCPPERDILRWDPQAVAAHSSFRKAVVFMAANLGTRLAPSFKELTHPFKRFAQAEKNPQVSSNLSVECIHYLLKKRPKSLQDMLPLDPLRGGIILNAYLSMELVDESLYSHLIACGFEPTPELLKRLEDLRVLPDAHCFIWAMGYSARKGSPGWLPFLVEAGITPPEKTLTEAYTFLQKLDPEGELYTYIRKTFIPYCYKQIQQISGRHLIELLRSLRQIHISHFAYFFGKLEVQPDTLSELRTYASELENYDEIREFLRQNGLPWDQNDFYCAFQRNDSAYVDKLFDAGMQPNRTTLDRVLKMSISVEQLSKCCAVFENQASEIPDFRDLNWLCYSPAMINRLFSILESPFDLYHVLPCLLFLNEENLTRILDNLTSTFLEKDLVFEELCDHNIPQDLVRRILMKLEIPFPDPVDMFRRCPITVETIQEAVKENVELDDEDFMRAIETRDAWNALGIFLQSGLTPNLKHYLAVFKHIYAQDPDLGRQIRGLFLQSNPSLVEACYSEPEIEFEMDSDVFDQYFDDLFPKGFPKGGIPESFIIKTTHPTVTRRFLKEVTHLSSQFLENSGSGFTFEEVLICARAGARVGGNTFLRLIGPEFTSDQLKALYEVGMIPNEGTLRDAIEKRVSNVVFRSLIKTVSLMRNFQQVPERIVWHPSGVFVPKWS
jgi:hypothetical protein